MILLLTYIVGVGQFSHIIAGSAESAFAVITGHGSVADYFLRFLLPTLIGNTLGGVALVALLNHAPLVPELQGEDQEFVGWKSEAHSTFFSFAAPKPVECAALFHPTIVAVSKRRSEQQQPAQHQQSPANGCDIGQTQAGERQRIDPAAERKQPDHERSPRRIRQLAAAVGPHAAEQQRQRVPALHLHAVPHHRLSRRFEMSESVRRERRHRHRAEAGQCARTDP